MYCCILTTTLIKPITHSKGGILKAGSPGPRVIGCACLCMFVWLNGAGRGGGGGPPTFDNEIKHVARLTAKHNDEHVIWRFLTVYIMVGK